MKGEKESGKTRRTRLWLDYPHSRTDWTQMERHLRGPPPVLGLRRCSDGFLDWPCIVCAPHSLAESRRDLLGCLARQACVAAQQALPAGALRSRHSCTHTISAGAAKGVITTHTLSLALHTPTHRCFALPLTISTHTVWDLFSGFYYDASLSVNIHMWVYFFSSVTRVWVFDTGLSERHEYSSDRCQAWHHILSWHWISLSAWWVRRTNCILYVSRKERGMCA